MVWQVADDHLRSILSNAATDVDHAPDLMTALKKGKEHLAFRLCHVVTLDCPFAKEVWLVLC